MKRKLILGMVIHCEHRQVTGLGVPIKILPKKTRLRRCIEGAVDYHVESRIIGRVHYCNNWTSPPPVIR